MQQQVDHENCDGQDDRDFEQQHGEAAQAGLECCLGWPFAQADRDPAELGVAGGADHHADAGAAVHHCAHQRA
ncbi:hypothetical protein NKG94_51730 [Micromonospora sp. M12]